MKIARAITWASCAGLAAAGLLMVRPMGQRLLPARTGVVLSPASLVDLEKIRSSSSRHPIDARKIRPRSAELLKQQIETALILISAEPDPERREQLLLTALSDVAVTEIPSVVAMLQADSREGSLDLSARLVRRWAEIDPAAAAGWVAQLPDGRNRSNTLEQVAIAWGQVDPVAAVRWACLLPADGEWQDTLSSIASETVRAWPKEALTIAWELSPSPSRDEIILHAAAEWAMANPADASAWARQIVDPELRERALSAIAIAASERDPAAAGRLALSALPPGRLQDDAIVSIVERWAQKAPAQTAAWVEGFPAGELKFTAIENLAALWARDDDPRAQQWLDRLTLAARTAKLGLQRAN